MSRTPHHPRSKLDPNPDTETSVRVKRQKTMQTEPFDDDIVMLDTRPPTPPSNVVRSSSAKNAHLKGRKRFNADFSDLKVEGMEVGALQLTNFRPGEDEGQIAFQIIDRGKGDTRVASCTITVSDTSEYPKGHMTFGYSDDADVPQAVSDELDNLKGGVPIADTLERFLQRIGGAKSKPLAAALSKNKSILSDEEASDDESDGGGYYSEDDFDMGRPSPVSKDVERHRVLSRLQHDFLEVVSSGYRPGLIPFAALSSVSGGFNHTSDFAISVSIPTVNLTRIIPAQALVAWDRRLLGAPKARHLVLLISGFGAAYPAIAKNGEPAQKTTQLRFQLGICNRYKPSREHAVEANRTFGLLGKDAEDELREAREAALRAREAALYDDPDAYIEDDSAFLDPGPEEEPDDDDDGRFERFSLSSSLESLLDAQFVKLIAIRRKYGVGWGGAEMMFGYVEREQRSLDDVWKTYRKLILAADASEKAEFQAGKLPYDPLQGQAQDSEINLPYTAFSYLIRRLTICTRYCLVCHDKLAAEYEALKPYVCDRPLCTYQYYAHNRGASLEYEIIHNPETVDLLVSLAYSAAAEGVLDQPLPVGMALKVPLPEQSRVVTAPVSNHVRGTQQPETQSTSPVGVSHYKMDLDGLIDFDTMTVPHMRASIAALIDSLPSIEDMNRHLLRKVKPGKSKPRLKDMLDGQVLPAAWSILRWCIASCTAYLEDMSSSGEQLIQGVDPSWRQFRFSVGAPDAEAKFQKALSHATATDHNAKKYPSLYAFHGSALRNWHSIVRHGLWFKSVANGRAFGDGVYLAKEAQTSMGTYAQGGRACWRKSKLAPSSCVAIAEVVNLPHQFVSFNPHFVIKDTEWIVCRYLLVKALEPHESRTKTNKAIPLVKIDPAQTITMQNQPLKLPQPGYQIAELVQQRQRELIDEPHDDTDYFVFSDHKPPAPVVKAVEISDEEYEPVIIVRSKGKAPVAKGPPADDWQHDEDYVRRTIELLMPPPFESSSSASMAVQRELKGVLREQEKAMKSPEGLRGLGWYLPQDLMGDNLFQWIVEMHSFESSLPIAQDMKAAGINSLIFEIRFPPTYPIGPPFFRIITPRFLPFINGGGGHVTGGGSICMDLLTADNWMPTYSIPAVLMQIRLAISNLDPRPARLAPNWKLAYSPSEALAGFKRAAATHGWTLPAGLDKLVQ
ncbi:unnamed protein product [Mycena citricolor]|uniref:UBC core domain-containing protein n=1 Tax=Mycena citricolor TaxID=2018698 RepID=A0AAD2GVV1_9AGAR|nr:unnamed protein product [Mycena citricolor]